ncbi:HTH domain-containing protein [Pleurocapsa sp. PCC 7319]|uniref:HTH domain-containing protein n=1 Tax=Pleurocapsa sp. PCC 7319 TaxID=118161 RepID=UPI000349C64F|nr:HTH domain-containing protein [Pleurocapsa sp. PCC 7319]
MSITAYFEELSSKPIFFVLEDHPEVAENNCLYLQKIEPSASCVVLNKPQQVWERLKLEIPSLFVIDLQIGNITGEQSTKESLELLEYIFGDYPKLNILVYTSEHSYLRPLRKLISKHQGGFVINSKMQRRKHFVQGAKSALAGQLVLPPDLRQEVDFSSIESQILQLLGQQYLTDKAIARELNVSVRKVQNHIQQLKLKLDIDGLEPSCTSFRVALSMEAVRRKMLLI